MDANLSTVIFWVTVILWVVGVAALWIGRNSEFKQKQHAEIVKEWGEIFVGAAEQLYSQNEQKFLYAYNLLLKKAAAVAPELSEDEVRAVVEWAVQRLKQHALTAIDWAEVDTSES